MSKQEVAISIRGVSKDFLLPHERTSSIKSGILNVFKRKNKETEIQHALKDISFEVEEGDFFGIVGRNGSGKSTLLKIIAEIYKPTTGSVFKNGKLVPFIELGVGFNPELTGRENVYLNGALLGFSKKEIDARYQDIVEFAELEDFMDQKLKNYSSGMQVRLAFSVAIKAEGDILVLDEVLAVGDEAFQRKCDEYFRTIKEDKTKTIILVTHSMDAVRRFCNKAMLIRDSKIVKIGSPEDVANQYTEDNFKSPRSKSSRENNELFRRVPYFRIVSKQKRVLSNEKDLKFDVEYEINDDAPIRVFISIIDEKRGVSILANGTEAISKKGKNKLTYVFPLKYYNDCNLLVNAVIDEAETKKRIAFTDEEDSYRCAVRNTITDGGLLRKDNNIHGYWVDHKEFSYNLKDM